MPKAMEWGSRRAGGLAVLLLSAALLGPAARAQETPEQFDAANAETRRHSEAENDLRNQAHNLRTGQSKALLQCQGGGSPAARDACTRNVEIEQRQRGLDLDNQVIREDNNHSLILKGIGVHRVP